MSNTGLTKGSAEANEKRGEKKEKFQEAMSVYLVNKGSTEANKPV
jgi:hypothetical protein